MNRPPRRHVRSGPQPVHGRHEEQALWADGVFENTYAKEDGVWTHSGDFSYAYDTNEFSQTVVLPEGAEIVSVQPWPVAKFTLKNKPTVRFEATRGHNDPFKYTVQYRLADKAVQP